MDSEPLRDMGRDRVKKQDMRRESNKRNLEQDSIKRRQDHMERDPRERDPRDSSRRVHIPRDRHEHGHHRSRYDDYGLMDNSGQYDE